MKLSQFKLLSFDCYGTLIDWETGLVAALAPLLLRAQANLSRDAVLERYAAHETREEHANPHTPYAQLLSIIYQKMEDDLGLPRSPGEALGFGESVANWPAFADSQEALSYLQQHFKLVVLSNIDEASFLQSQRHLGVTFDAVYTAEKIGSYKPDARNFAYLIEHVKSDFGIEPSEILHTAQSLFHDHVPANAVHLASAFIDRGHGQSGWGATPPPEPMPHFDFHFDSLTAMAAAHRLELSRLSA